MNKLNIREPYYSAGIKYKWPQKPVGLGIARKHFNGDGDIELTVGDDPQIWVVDKKGALDFVRKYNSVYIIKGVKLGVVAWELFKKQEQVSALKLDL